jgi:hypothetical protein
MLFTVCCHGYRVMSCCLQCVAMVTGVPGVVMVEEEVLFDDVYELCEVVGK